MSILALRRQVNILYRQENKYNVKDVEHEQDAVTGYCANESVRYGQLTESIRCL